LVDLLCNNVLDLKRCEDVGFREAAVFTAIGGPLPNLLLGHFRHPWNLGKILTY
jgi:hypothetical protein